MKKYKALILDVDGTLVPNAQHAMPSIRVKKAIDEAKKRLHVGLASGRPLFLLKEIFEDLKLSGPSIILGGSIVINSQDYKAYWEKGIEKEDIQKVFAVFKKHSLLLYYDEEFDQAQIHSNLLPEVAYSLYSGKVSITREAAERAFEDLLRITTIKPHILPGWGGGAAINITHASATKQHGIFEVGKILNIDPSEFIAVGDGGNDFPLLMSCGFKVAMGNATDDLKAIADYVAPSVAEDGVADVIERFILNKKIGDEQKMK